MSGGMERAAKEEALRLRAEAIKLGMPKYVKYFCCRCDFKYNEWIPQRPEYFQVKSLYCMKCVEPMEWEIIRNGDKDG